jgi:outer membrane biosynthesis protein TonB
VVRVTADESGNVISDNLDHPGPSNYFAKVATQAARKWKFVPDGRKSGGVWLIHFEFARTGTTAHATGAKS